MDEQLIPQFVQQYYAAQAALQSGDRAKAVAAYQELLAKYKEVSSSALERPHKELAHQQVQTVYSGIAAMPRSAPMSLPSSAFVSASSSRVSLEQLATDQSFLSSLGVKDFVTIGVFAVVIMLVLFFKPEYIGFTTFESGNHAPEWVGKTTAYALSVGVPLTIPLKDSFRDAENDELVYLATGSSGIDVSVTDNSVTLLASQKGTSTIVVMASDLSSITKVPLTISVA